MHHFANQIKKRITEDFHANASVHAQIHGRQIRSLEEVTEAQMTSQFSETDDRLMEEQALKSLKERQALHGRK